jgi:hypothetical protein
VEDSLGAQSVQESCNCYLPSDDTQNFPHESLHSMELESRLVKRYGGVDLDRLTHLGRSKDHDRASIGG